jgi:hypothetical protein
LKKAYKEKPGFRNDPAFSCTRKNSEKGFEGFALIGLGRVLDKKETQQVEKVEKCFHEGLAIFNDLKMKPFYSQELMFLGSSSVIESKKRRPWKT